MLYYPEKAFSYQSLLGESATWAQGEGALYWVDTHGQKVNRADPATGAVRSYDLPSKPGCLALIADTQRALVAARDGIYELDLATGQVSLNHPVPFDPGAYRINDGRCDRQGRFWFGSLHSDFVQDIGLAKGRGAYYRYDGRTLTPVIGDITMPNGTAFSPDGRTMYRAESYDREIWAYDYDPVCGSPTNPRIFARVPERYGIPDGATVDTAGHYWTALPLGGGWVLRFDQTGQLVGEYRIPTACPTMVTFGGADRATLYITSMQYPNWDPSEDPDAGCVFMMETDAQGCADDQIRIVV